VLARLPVHQTGSATFLAPAQWRIHRTIALTHRQHNGAEFVLAQGM